MLSQETEYGAVVSSDPMFAPSTLNCTPATATLSEALAETVTLPDTVAPLAGAVMTTVGAVVSGSAADGRVHVLQDFLRPSARGHRCGRRRFWR